MSFTNQTVSVIIPAYNRAATIGRAVSSVLDQTYADWELLIIDDASSDDLAGTLGDVLQRPNVRLIRHQQNRGVSAARNTGIDAATGRYVAFLDSDDAWRAAKLERQMAAIESAPDPPMTFCVTQTLIIMDDGWSRVRPLNGPAANESFASFLYSSGGFAQVSSFLLSRELAASIRFREQMRQYEDHLFFVEAGARGAHYLLVPEPLSIWHNETRADRLSSDESISRARIYLEAARDILDDRERLAFEVRTTTAKLWESDRYSALRLIARARRAGVIDNRLAAEILIRTAAPRQIYEWLRRHGSP